MTQKLADGYRLPGVSREGIPQYLQLKAHESFTPEYITTRNPMTPVIGDGPAVAFTATPPDWTEQAACAGEWVLFDQPSAAQFRQQVKPICDGCPVKDLCLQAAMSEEGDQPANFRAGVRGGLLPKDRAILAVGGPQGVCERGHDKSELGGYFNVATNSWSCAECSRERKRVSRAAGDNGHGSKMPCEVCGLEMWRDSLPRHRRNKHPELTFATDQEEEAA